MPRSQQRRVAWLRDIDATSLIAATTAARQALTRDAEAYAHDAIAHLCQRAGQLRDYSVNNVALILAQKPDASLLAGETRWRQLGYQPRDGFTPVGIWAAGKRVPTNWTATNADPSEVTVDDKGRRRLRHAGRSRAARVVTRNGRQVVEVATDAAPVSWKALRVIDVSDVEPIPGETQHDLPTSAGETDDLADVVATVDELAAHHGVSCDGAPADDTTAEVALRQRARTVLEHTYRENRDDGARDVVLECATAVMCAALGARVDDWQLANIGRLVAGADGDTEEEVQRNAAKLLRSRFEDARQLAVETLHPLTTRNLGAGGKIPAAANHRDAVTA